MIEEKLVALAATCMVFVPGISVAHGDCSAPHANEPILQKSDYKVANTILDLQVQYDEIYNGKKRLPYRVYYDTTQRSYYVDRNGRILKVPDKFLNALRRHIELAFERGYADFLFYPDMGHLHVLRPIYGENFLASQDRIDLSDSQVKFLFHTAELLVLKPAGLKGSLVDDPWLQWRYHSRNFVAANIGDESLEVLFAKDADYNTVRSLDGYQEIGRIALSSHRSGCFSFNKNGEGTRFDIGFEDLSF